MKTTSTLLRVCLFVVACCCFGSLYAQTWEQVYQLPTTKNIFVAPNGNLIASDFQYDYTGGIYYSTDQGETWTKCDIEDYCYNRMVVAGEYIIATGEGCHIARSKDNGVTWELLSYGYMFTDLISEEAIETNVAYGLCYFKNKIFIADSQGGGVVYSEDFGETWNLTDRTSLEYDMDGKPAIDCFYNLAENNGELLLFSAYFVYRLNEDDFTWELLRTDSNFMATSTTMEDKLVCGRSIANFNRNSPFLEYTSDGGRNWGHIAHADTVEYDCYVRAVHYDDQYLFAALIAKGIFFTTDMGERWVDITDNLPVGGSAAPLMITSDEKYIYVALYDQPWEKKKSGVYRYNKDNLASASLKNTINDNIEVVVSNNIITVKENARIAIYNAAGAQVLVANNCNTLDISALEKGVYFYDITTARTHTAGKFVR